MSNIYTDIRTKLNKAFPYLHVTNKELENFKNEILSLDYLKSWCDDLPKNFVHVPTKTSRKVTLRDIFFFMPAGVIIGKS